MLDLLPLSHIPPTYLDKSCEKCWLAGDSQENYERDMHALRSSRQRQLLVRWPIGKHLFVPSYGPDDISYVLNSRGYRSPEFDVEADIRVLSIGCSYVFGIGLPQSHLFHELFAQRLRDLTDKTVVNWNLGVSGRSNEYIVRLLSIAIPQLNPHLVLVNFTSIMRREYWCSDFEQVAFHPTFAPSDPKLAPVGNHLRALSNHFDGILNYARCYQAAESLLSDRFWLYSETRSANWAEYFRSLSRRKPIAATYSGIFDTRNFVGYLAHLDRARDNHPGPKSHASLFERYWERFQRLGGVDQLLRGTGSPLAETH